MIPKLEITTTNETLQFDLPEGENEVCLLYTSPRPRD